MRVALATNSEHPHLVAGEALLPPAFQNVGVQAIPVMWNDPNAAWHEFDFVILRTCWGYYQHVAQFISWIDMLQTQRIQVVNEPALIRWNAHKKYLLELQQKGVPIPPTLLVPSKDRRHLADILRQLPSAAHTHIIKPCYGAAAFDVIKVDGGNLPRYETAYQQMLDRGDVLVQAFVPEIATGEYSAVFINGALSHTVLKKPKAGEFRANYEFGGSEHLLQMDAGATAQVENLFRQCGVGAFYARRDFIPTASGPLLMALALIEPYLFLDLAEYAPERFAQTFVEVFGNRQSTNPKSSPK